MNHNMIRVQTFNVDTYHRLVFYNLKIKRNNYSTMNDQQINHIMIRRQNIIVFCNWNKHNRGNNTIEQIDNPNNYINQRKLVNNNNPFLLWSSNLKKNGDCTWRFQSWDDTETTEISNNLLLLVSILTTTIKDGGEQHELSKKYYYLVNTK